MAAAGRGSMIGFSSIRSQTTEPGQGAYAATKAATVMLFKTLAAELGPRGVRANTIAPGVVETPLTAPIKAQADWYDAYAQKSIFGGGHNHRRWSAPWSTLRLMPAATSPARRSSWTAAGRPPTAASPRRPDRPQPMSAVDAAASSSSRSSSCASRASTTRIAGSASSRPPSWWRRRCASFGWTPELDEVAAGATQRARRHRGRRRAGPDAHVRGPHRCRHRGRPGWTVDPFGGELVDGRLWGRGSADMKGGLVAAMSSPPTPSPGGGPFPGRIVHRRAGRRGGHDGRRQALRRHGAAPTASTALICCEPEGGEICHVAKGALRLRLDFTGKMAHGAMPFQGRNPNRAVGAAIGVLADLEAAVQARARRPPVPRQGRGSRRPCWPPASRCR